MLKLLLKLAVVALLANAAWWIGSSYVSFYKFKDAVAEEAQFGVDKSVDQLRERVVGLAQQFDLPVDGDALTIAKGDQRTRIAGSSESSRSIAASGTPSATRCVGCCCPRSRARP